MISEIIAPDHSIAWLPWAVTYFFFIGISYAAVMLSLPAVLFGHKQYEKIAGIAILVMMVSVLAAMAGLLGDLHQPGRFWHFYAYFTPISWMSIGSIILPVYMLGIFVYAWLYLRIRWQDIALAHEDKSWLVSLLLKGNWGSRRALKIMAGVTALLALLIVLYTGSEVIIVRARPLWNSNFLLFFYLSSALVGAVAVSLVLGKLIDIDSSTQEILSRWLRWAVLFFLLTTLLWMLSAYLGKGAAATALVRVKNSPEFMTSLMILLVLTLATFLFTYIKGGFLWLAAIAGLVVTWFSRWIIFIDGQRIPKYGAGYYPYQLPAGGDGLLGIIGIFGLAVFLGIVLYHYLPWKLSLQSGTDTSSST